MPTDSQPTIYWFRRDLRLRDNPALHWAVKRKKAPVYCVYIYETDFESGGDSPDWEYGGASRWWLHHSLDSLANDLASAGNRLRLFTGSPKKILTRVVAETSASTIAWNRRYEPKGIALDTYLKTTFTDQGIEVHSSPGNLCHEPWVVTRQGTKAEGKQPYKVFTAYWRASLKHDSLPVSPSAKTIPGTGTKLKGEKNLASLKLLPRRPWADKFPQHWQPGEKGATKNLQILLKKSITDYGTGRDLPAQQGTSKLSPHLAFGEISPRQINAAVARNLKDGSISADDNVETFLKEIGWREFAYHLLYHFPHTTEQPLDKRFTKFPWKKVKSDTLDRWQQGNTGIPLVDAGMRQLWQTGWMHNRVRMVVGSLLIKNMGYRWLEGARWFWDTLVDADLASNTMGWQWVAGSGADAAPYFRVFNPVRQGERFDPEGEYIKRWVPEIANLPKKHIHSPWTASETELEIAGIVLGETYPHPIVDLKDTRVEALERFAKIKTS